MKFIPFAVHTETGQHVFRPAFIYKDKIMSLLTNQDILKYTALGYATAHHPEIVLIEKPSGDFILQRTDRGSLHVVATESFVVVEEDGEQVLPAFFLTDPNTEPDILKANVEDFLVALKAWATQPKEVPADA